MIKTVSVKDFLAVPYLETSSLMTNHPKGIKFSTTKPNVIVGPNGAGKSALLKALALFTQSFYTGETSFDDNYVLSNESSTYWKQVGSSWGHDYAYLAGLECVPEACTSIYYRPGAIPGDEHDVTHAMMTGYFNEAKAFARLTENKSSGQRSQAILAQVQACLAGKLSDFSPKFVNWRFGQDHKDFSGSRSHTSYFQYQAEILKKRFSKAVTSPVVLMDEPEQSLDARAELMLWKQIETAPEHQVQVIVATHSLYPLMHPKKFHIVEAVSGYAAEVSALI
jgi:predicted ATPase